MRLVCFSLGCLLLTLLGAPTARAAVPAVAQAETSVRLNAGAQHTQYHENANPGDDESGFTPGFGVGISALVPLKHGWNPDLYTALDYDFDAGSIRYNGHYLVSGAPLSTGDNAVFNRIEARIGLGYQLPHSGIELIPYAAAGYQAWNRNIDISGSNGTNEFYHTGLFGGGARLDLPLTQQWIASFDGEILALAGGGITANNFGFSQDFGVSGAQRISLGLDDAFSTRLHFTGAFSWQHFNYTGTKPQLYDYVYELHEPLSSTQQFGATIGVAYSFY